MKLENILPEIRKGRKFRVVNNRPGQWFSLSDLDNINNYKASYFLTTESFELELEKKEISLEDLKIAWNNAVRVEASVLLSEQKAENSTRFRDFVKRLGFTV